MGTTRPTTEREQPSFSSFSIMCGSAASDELVPSTISSSSLMYEMKRRMLKPVRRATVPSTNTTKTMAVK
ncbi:hypothetical protein D9M72_583550 [compost metagenome]